MNNFLLGTVVQARITHSSFCRCLNSPTIGVHWINARRVSPDTTNSHQGCIHPSSSEHVDSNSHSSFPNSSFFSLFPAGLVQDPLQMLCTGIPVVSVSEPIFHALHEAPLSPLKFCTSIKEATATNLSEKHPAVHEALVKYAVKTWQAPPKI